MLERKSVIYLMTILSNVKVISNICLTFVSCAIIACNYWPFVCMNSKLTYSTDKHFYNPVIAPLFNVATYKLLNLRFGLLS